MLFFSFTLFTQFILVFSMSSFRQSIEDQFNAVVISTNDAALPAVASASRRLGFNSDTPDTGESLDTVSLIGGGEEKF